VRRPLRDEPAFREKEERCHLYDGTERDLHPLGRCENGTAVVKEGPHLGCGPFPFVSGNPQNPITFMAIPAIAPPVRGPITGMMA
jgi:hypothetical protein